MGPIVKLEIFVPRRSLKRVAEKLDCIDARIGQQKFAGNFNYALKK